MTDQPRIDRITTAAYTFPTPEPEADGTLEWQATTAVTVLLEAGGESGLGWTYSSPAAVGVVQHHLVSAVRDHDAFDIAGGWSAMQRACRNLGTKGLVMQAISAVDVAWWDLKARLLGVPLVDLLGQVRAGVPIYGSGGFVTMNDRELEQQVGWWQSVGCRAMKIKIAEDWGARADRDLARVRRLRDLAGPRVALMVDANGGYRVKQAQRVGECLDELGVIWYEEPVSSDDPTHLARLSAALRCDVTAGEYAADVYDTAALLDAVDCLQLDATRCGGYTGWLRCAAVAASRNLDVSAHCAPAVHAPVAAALPHLRHIEWFADHVRLEAELVDGAPPAHDGAVWPRRDCAGHGMTLSAHAIERRVA